jgi:hypothetical protein
MQFSPRTIWCAGPILGLIGFAVLSSSGASAAEETCRKSLGEKAAQRLAWECLEVTPTIHAPCNAAATCSAIVSEISRGCSILRDSLLKYPERGIVSKENRDPLKVPKFCSKYLAGP